MVTSGYQWCSSLLNVNVYHFASWLHSWCSMLQEKKTHFEFEGTELPIIWTCNCWGSRGLLRFATVSVPKIKLGIRNQLSIGFSHVSFFLHVSKDIGCFHIGLWTYRKNVAMSDDAETVPAPPFEHHMCGLHVEREPVLVDHEKCNHVATFPWFFLCDDRPLHKLFPLRLRPMRYYHLYIYKL